MCPMRVLSRSSFGSIIDANARRFLSQSRKPKFIPSAAMRHGNNASSAIPGRRADAAAALLPVISGDFCWSVSSLIFSLSHSRLPLDMAEKKLHAAVTYCAATSRFLRFFGYPPTCPHPGTKKLQEKSKRLFMRVFSLWIEARPGGHFFFAAGTFNSWAPPTDLRVRKRELPRGIAIFLVGRKRPTEGSLEWQPSGSIPRSFTARAARSRIAPATARIK